MWGECVVTRKHPKSTKKKAPSEVISDSKKNNNKTSMPIIILNVLDDPRIGRGLRTFGSGGGRLIVVFSAAFEVTNNGKN